MFKFSFKFRALLHDVQNSHLVEASQSFILKTVFQLVLQP